MADRLDFELRLVDALSAPAGAAASSLDRLTNAAQAGADGAQRFEIAIKQATGATTEAGAAAQKTGDGLGALRWRDVIDGALAAGAALRDFVGDVIRTAGEYSRLDNALRLTAGDRYEALSEVFQQVSGVGAADDDVLAKAALPLIRRGVRDEDTIRKLLLAAEDLAATSGDGTAGVSTALDKLTRIAVLGRVDGRSLVELGLNERDFYSSLAKQLNVNEKQARRLVEQGKIATQDLLNATLGQIAAQQGGVLGQAAATDGRTLGGALERLSNLFGNTVKQLGTSPVAEALRVQIERIIDVFTGAGGAAPKIQALLARAGAGITDALRNVDAESVGEFLDDLITTAQFGITVFGGVAAIFRELGTEIGEFAGAIYLGVNALADFGGAIGDGIAGFFVDIDNAIGSAQIKIGEWWKVFRDGALSIGEQLWRGLVDGIVVGIPRIIEGVTELGNEAIGALKRVFGIASPAKVSIDVGENVGGTLADTLTDQGRTRVRPALDDVFSIPADAFDGQLPALGGVGAPVINLTINYTAAPGGIGSDAETIAALAVDAITAKLAAELA